MPTMNRAQLDGPSPASQPVSHVPVHVKEMVPRTFTMVLHQPVRPFMYLLLIKFASGFAAMVL